MVKKKLTPASICSQKKWANLPITKKNSLRKLLPDKDKDGVPNKFDCRPKNKRKQETFLSEDAMFLSSSPQIRLGKKLGQGAAGEVFFVKGNKNLVVKVPRGMVNPDDEYASQMNRSPSGNSERIRLEMELYNKYNLESEPMCIPTREINLGSNKSSGMIGLVRPFVKTINDLGNTRYSKTLTKLTDPQVETIRQKLIELSYKGFVLLDGFQVGIDRVGRPLLYDLEFIENRRGYSKPHEIFEHNNHYWRRFLFDMGKLHGTEDARGIAKYGEVKITISRVS